MGQIQQGLAHIIIGSQRMVSRVPVLLLICLIPLLASALSEEGESNEVKAPSAELSSLVKREALPLPAKKKCRNGKCRKKNCKNGNCKKRSKGKRNGAKRSRQMENDQNDNSRNERRQRRKKTRKIQERQNGNERQITGNATSCAMKAIKYARLFEGKATSISRQVKRIQGNDRIQGSKGKKKGDFNATMDRLVAALGGDAENPKCDGEPIKDSSSTNATFRNGTIAKSTIDTLKNCEKDIAEKRSTAVTGNATKLAELEACGNVSETFKTNFEKCLVKTLSIDDACKCVEALDDPEAELKKCNPKADNDNALKLKKACKKAVGQCKDAEAKAAEGIDSCKERTKCGGVKDPEEAKRQLKVLTPLKAALDNPAMSNALKATGLDKGPGADGQVPARFMTSIRSKRDTDGAGCTSLGDAWGKFNTSATKTAMSASGDLDEASANETTGILNDINGRSSLEDDLTSCATDRQGVTVSVTIVKIRITLFWCLWWQTTIIEVKITIITVTFGVTTPSVGTTTPTTVVSRDPNAGRKLMLQNLND